MMNSPIYQTKRQCYNSRLFQKMRQQLPWSELSVGVVFNGLTCIIIARSFLESLLENQSLAPDNLDFYRESLACGHVYISWLCLFGTFAVLIKAILGIRLLESFKTAVLFSPLILIVPFIDYFTKGGGDINYGINFSDFCYNYVNLFNPMAHITMVTTGVRIEVLLATVGAVIISCVYFKRTLLRGGILSLAIYTTIFCFGYLPAMLPGFGAAANLSFLPMYIPICLVLAIFIFISLLHEDRQWAKLLLHLFFPSRLLFYLLLVLFGTMFTAKQAGLYPEIFMTGGIINLSFAVLSITSLFLNAIIQNDYYDRDIDIVSNPERIPLLSDVSSDDILSLKSFFLVPSMIFGLAANRYFIQIWLLIYSFTVLYSEPPFRLRRFYPIGHCILSLIGVSAFMAGSVVIGSREFFKIPNIQSMAIWIFIAFFFICHIKDFKDIEGDKHGGVMNVFAWTKVPRLIGVLVVIGFAASVIMIIRVLSIFNQHAVFAVFIYLFLASALICCLKDYRKLDRIMVLSLVLVIYLSAVWLKAINA